MTETDLLNAVMDLTALYGWKRMHARPALTKHGWRTPLQGDKGFPDLCLSRDDRLIFAELKSDIGKPTPEQSAWLESLAGAAETYVWTPTDWNAGTIQRQLERPVVRNISTPAPDFLRCRASYTPLYGSLRRCNLETGHTGDFHESDDLKVHTSWLRTPGDTP